MLSFAVDKFASFYLRVREAEKGAEQLIESKLVFSGGLCEIWKFYLDHGLSVVRKFQLIVERLFKFDDDKWLVSRPRIVCLFALYASVVRACWRSGGDSEAMVWVRDFVEVLISKRFSDFFRRNEGRLVKWNGLFDDAVCFNKCLIEFVIV